MKGMGSGQCRLALSLSLVLSFGAAACGGDSESDGGDSAGGNGQDVLRAVQAPDPIWNWMRDEGILAEMEEEWGITLEVNETFDRFPILAGGHAAVSQVGTYDLPDYASKGVPLVSFGKYNRAKDLWVAPPGSDAEGISDLPQGAKLGAFSFTGTTTLWAAMLEQSLGEDFRTSDRWELVIADTARLPELVSSGELDAAIVDPQLTVTQIADNELKPLYDGNTTAEMFAEVTGGSPSVQTNMIVAREDWYAQNERKARFYLALWDRGLQEWEQHRHEIIEKYPDDFSIDEPSDVDTLVNYLDTKFNWIDEQATIDQEFVEAQKNVFDLMKEIGAMAPNQEDPRFEILEPGQP